MKYDIFLSHCKEDKMGVAFPLYQALEALGFTVWIDRNEIAPGDEIYENITEAIQNSACADFHSSSTYLRLAATKKQEQREKMTEKAPKDHKRNGHFKTEQ